MVSAIVPSMSKRNAVGPTTAFPIWAQSRHPAAVPFRYRASHISERNAGQQASLTGVETLPLASHMAEPTTKAPSNIVTEHSCSLRDHCPIPSALFSARLTKPTADYDSGTSSVTRSPAHSFSSTIEASRIGTSISPRRNAVRKWPGAGDRTSSVKSS